MSEDCHASENKAGHERDLAWFDKLTKPKPAPLGFSPEDLEFLADMRIKAEELP